MDTIGYITDASVKVLPSEKLSNFINDLEIQDNMPQSLQIFKGNTKIGNVHNEIKSNDSYMTIEDFALLKSLLKKSETDSEPQVKSDLDQSFSKTNDTKQGKNGVKGESNVSKDNEKKKEDTSPHVTDKYLYLCDLEWLSLYLTNLRKDNEYIYLHELLEGSDILLPENEVIKRNPVLEARCVRLRLEQSNRDYRSMTKNVDNVRARQPEESIAYQLKGLNRQLIAIGQFVISLGAGFLFGFLGIELMIGGLDFGFRLLLGVMCALIIALAEIYFLAKKLNEDLAIGETIQLGGPPVYPTKNHKEHKD